MSVFLVFREPREAAAVKNAGFVGFCAQCKIPEGRFLVVEIW